MKVSELKGTKGLYAVQAFHHLMLGLKMLPAYMHESYEDFFERISKLSDEDKLKVLREAIMFVKLEPDELKPLVALCCDSNGVPFGPSNIDSLSPEEFIDVILSVCIEVSKFKIGILSETEKKN